MGTQIWKSMACKVQTEKVWHAKFKLYVDLKKFDNFKLTQIFYPNIWQIKSNFWQNIKYQIKSNQIFDKKSRSQIKSSQIFLKNPFLQIKSDQIFYFKPEPQIKFMSNFLGTNLKSNFFKLIWFETKFDLFRGSSNDLNTPTLATQNCIKMSFKPHFGWKTSFFRPFLAFSPDATSHYSVLWLIY